MTGTVRPTAEQRDNYLRMVATVEGLPNEAFEPADDRFAVLYRKFLSLVAASQVAEASRVAHRLAMVAGDALLPALNGCANLLRSGVDWRDIPLPAGIERLEVRDLSLFLIFAEGEPIAA